jgi:hypothetical protein
LYRAVIEKFGEISVDGVKIAYGKTLYQKANTRYCKKGYENKLYRQKQKHACNK